MLRYACVLVIGLLAAGTARADVAITACGQFLENGEIGVLQADIVCEAPTQTGVVVGLGATLRLNGHRISGGNYGISCSRRCKVEGPGEVTGFAQAGVDASNIPHTKVVIRDVDIHDNLVFGVLLPFDASLVMDHVSVHNNNHGGIALGNSNSFGRVRGSNVMINDNNGPGVSAKRIRLSDSTISSNDGTGIYSVNGTVRLVRSVVNGNGTVFTPSYDLKTFKLPHLVGSTCGLSGRLLAGAVLSGTWSVCAND